MKKAMRIMISCLLCAALLFGMAAIAFAGNGPYPEHSESFYYARLELVVLDEKEQPVMVNNGEWEEQKTLPLYAGGKVTAQDGAAYDLASNTLTLTDFNKGNYLLRVNLMGDDFTICVKGDCRLSSVVVYGGGVMQPKWGGSLRITGDGTLSVNANKVNDSGIIFYPQEEDKTHFTVDAGVGLSVCGKKTAIEAYGYTGEFTMTSGGKPVEIKKETAVRELYVGLPGYSNPLKANIRLCRSAADPEGIYAMNDWYRNDELVNVTVQRFVHIEKYDLYLVDYEWGHGDGETGRVEFANVAEANAAGYTWVLDADGEQEWLTVDSMGNYSSTEFVWQDAKGDRYIKGHDYNKDCDVTLTIEPLEELPGQYLFLETTAVDPASLTQVTEARVMEGMYDYTYPDKELKYTAQSAAAFLIGDVDNNGKVESADARLALRASVKLENYAEGTQPYLAADVDHNGKIESSDARSILRASVNLEKLA